ncbi:hypothetical protein SPSYN_02231 [Sporotomaculum syntrophicum]|uniref:CoA-binding domain-containing protein n=1 Tax=Sporotomaculum syntrophicum TaxID=182264 RepID=A0A9D2WNI5_9FIRM|nr:CoA-binding protein [Sporotomaculum syntrophicum]KAF1084454.1 hypothetical protein SPSYN_02231 [Sporotomaculum syntrophicum]
MNDFFARFKSLAVLGLSRKPKSFSRQAYDFLQSQGYELYPVNPHAKAIAGQACYDSVEALPEVEAAVFFTPPGVSMALLPLCKEKGIVYVWFQQGSADKAVLKVADELGITYTKSCVFLHQPGAGFPHNVHRILAGVFGKL